MGQHSEAKGNIHGDYLIELTVEKSGQNYPKLMRLVIATAEVDGKEKLMTFITNNMEWDTDASMFFMDYYRMDMEETSKITRICMEMSNVSLHRFAGMSLGYGMSV